MRYKISLLCMLYVRRKTVGLFAFVVLFFSPPGAVPEARRERTC